MVSKLNYVHSGWNQMVEWAHWKHYKFISYSIISYWACIEEFHSLGVILLPLLWRWEWFLLNLGRLSILRFNLLPWNTICYHKYILQSSTCRASVQWATGTVVNSQRASIREEKGSLNPFARCPLLPLRKRYPMKAKLR